MLKEVILGWEKTNLSDMDYDTDAFFYMFTRGNNLLYLGIAYYQDVFTEIRRTLRDFEIDTTGLSIWLGYIEDTDYGRITEQIVRDVECLLIHTHQPAYNTQCVANYTGRNNLKVRNRGCRLLRRCVKVENWEAYLTCR